MCVCERESFSVLSGVMHISIVTAWLEIRGASPFLLLKATNAFLEMIFRYTDILIRNFAYAIIYNCGASSFRLCSARVIISIDIKEMLHSGKR